MIIRLIILFITLCISTSTAFSQRAGRTQHAASASRSRSEAGQTAPEKPKLVLSIIVEQMRSDYIDRFGSLMGQDGFRRIFEQGTRCEQAFYNYYFTQTAPAYATLFTGADPASHGIVADEWYNSDARIMAGATFDVQVFPVGGSYASGQESPKQLRVSTLGDAIKLSSGKQGKVYGISMNPAGAILPAGYMADGAFWWDQARGLWMTSSFYMNTLPLWLSNLNAKSPGDKALASKWEPKLPITSYIGTWPDDNPYETGFKGRITFPYDPKALRNDELFSESYQIVKSIPQGNALTTDLALSLIAAESLGEDAQTDFLSVSYAATEGIGQLFGPYSIEVQDAFIRLDEEIAILLNYVDQHIGLEHVLVVFTSTSGCVDPPRYMADERMSVGYITSGNVISLLTSYLHAVYGEKDWIRSYSKNQIFLDRNLIESSKINPDDMTSTIASFLADVTGIASVFTSQDMLRNHYTSGIGQKVQQGFAKQRSGDVLMVLLPGWMERSTFTTAHNTSYAYDAHVPLVFFGWNVPQQIIRDEVDMTSVTPTVTDMLHILPPNGATGRPLHLIPDNL